MNPVVFTMCFLAQGVLLYRESPWPQALGLWLLLTLIYALFIYSRQVWNQHLDMFLIMLGPASLAMLAVPAWAMPSCPLHASPSLQIQHFALMSTAMLIVSLPLTWRYARCVQAAKVQQRALQILTLDSLAMLLAMAAVHFLHTLLPSQNAWLQHANMLIAMPLAMVFPQLLYRNTAKTQYSFESLPH